MKISPDGTQTLKNVNYRHWRVLNTINNYRETILFNIYLARVDAFVKGTPAIDIQISNYFRTVKFPQRRLI